MTLENKSYPTKWIKTILTECCHIIMGQSPKSSTYNQNEVGLPFYQGKREFGDTYPCPSQYCANPIKIAQENDILISVRAPVGPTNISPHKACIGRGLAAIRPLYGIKTKFILYFFRWIEPTISSHGTGSTFHAISKTYFNQLHIYLPSTLEQQHIVSKIEELFSELDSATQSLKKAQEQLKTYRQSVLKHAFEGKLTEEWRKRQKEAGNPPESAEKLLERIKQEREEHYQNQLAEWKNACVQAEAEGTKKPTKPKKPKDLPPLTEEELAELPELPEGWGWIKLGAIVKNIQTGPFGSQLHKSDYTEYGIPIINPKHIKDQKIYPQERISEDKANSLSQYILYQNDILLGRRGEIGRSVPITYKENGWFCGTGCLIIRLYKQINTKLLSLMLSEKRVIDYLKKHSRGTTMTNLNSKILNNLPIQILSTEEQNQIVSEIESRLSECDQLEKTIEDSLNKTEALRQSILKKAFSGELTKEWREENPKLISGENSAEKLLERITAEKKRTGSRKAAKNAK